jgi:hypothetical protein
VIVAMRRGPHQLKGAIETLQGRVMNCHGLRP